MKRIQKAGKTKNELRYVKRQKLIRIQKLSKKCILKNEKTRRKMKLKMEVLKNKNIKQKKSKKKIIKQQKSNEKK